MEYLAGVAIHIAVQVTHWVPLHGAYTVRVVCVTLHWVAWGSHELNASAEGGHLYSTISFHYCRYCWWIIQHFNISLLSVNKLSANVKILRTEAFIHWEQLCSDCLTGLSINMLYLGDNDQAVRALFVQHPRELDEWCRQNPSFARILT